MDDHQDDVDDDQHHQDDDDDDDGQVLNTFNSFTCFTFASLIV